MDVHRPANLDEATAVLADNEGVTVLAGGTDVMVEVNANRLRPNAVMTLDRIDELATWEGPTLGAMVTYRRMETGPYRALAQLARTVGSPQIRNAGTLGGNLGTASPAGDGLPFLAGLDAEVELVSRDGRRLMRWDSFLTGVKQNALEPGELIAAAVLPEDIPERQAFGKIGVRNAMVISMVSACVFRWDDGRTAVALGAVAPTVIRAPAAEEMISAEANPGGSALDEFQRLVSEEVSPITDHRATERYRRHAAGVLARRLLERCL